MTFDSGLHEVCVRVGVRVITKFSRIDSLPNFVTHGAALESSAIINNQVEVTREADISVIALPCRGTIHRIHKWLTRGKKLVPSRESEALEGKQKLQMKTFRELAECLARIPPKITLYGLLFKYNDVGRLLLLMFSTDLLFAIKRDAYIFRETG